MRTTSLLLTLAAAAVAVLLLPAAIANEAPPSPPADDYSPDARIAAARVLLQHGHFESALDTLRPLAERRPVDPDGLFQLGLVAIAASRQPDVSEVAREALLDEAIRALHTVLVREPGRVLARLELARAFYEKGDDRLARRHFERVLAGNPPAAVAANINRFLAAMRARRRWSMHLGFALAPDTNIGASSDERTIYIHGLPFRRDREELTTSGVGVSLWGGGEYQHPLGERLRLRAGADLSRREYRESRFDQMTVSSHLGPRWLVNERTEASALASARRHWLGNDPDRRDLGLRLEAYRRLGPQVTANAQASWFARRFDERTFLDGPVASLSLGGAWVVSPTVRLNAGLGLGRERADAERWRNSRRSVRAGATAALPWGISVGGTGTLRWTDYKGNWFPNTPAGEPRRDRIRSLRLFGHHRSFSIGGFTPQVSLVRELRDTNAQLYDYERTFGELSFVRLF